MKQLLLGTIGILSLGNAAIAADVPAHAFTKASAIDPAYNWTGFYAGVHAGYGLGGTEWQILNIRTDGALGGIQAGYNQQIGNLLLGIEADISFSGIKGNRTVSILNQATVPDVANQLAVDGDRTRWLRQWPLAHLRQGRLRLGQ